MSTPPTSSTAMKFSLLRAFSNSLKDNSVARVGYFEELADQLSDYDLADTIFLAVLQGNDYVARRLLEYRGPISFEYVNRRPNMMKHTLNGEDVNPGNAKALCNLRSLADLKAVLRTAAEFNLKGLIEPGLTYPALFRKIDRADTIIGSKADRFTGELPELSSGVLYSPELAIALDLEASRNPHSGAYKPMLCWATQEMVDDFPGDLSPLRPFQHVSSPTFNGSMDEWRADESSSRLLFTELDVGVEPSAEARFGDKLMHSMCPLAAQYGFEDVQGRVLCETSTDFLLQFEVAGTIPSNEQAARVFAEQYMPVEIMADLVAEECSRDYGHPSTEYRFQGSYKIAMKGDFNGLFELLAADGPLRKQALSMMEPEQWKTLLGKTEGRKLTAKSLLAMYQTFSVDNTGLSIEVDYLEIPAFIEGGYRFSDETIFFEYETKFNEYLRDHRLDRSLGKATAVYSFLNKALLIGTGPDGITPEENPHELTKYFSGILSLNLWPSDTKKPEGLRDLLNAASTTDLGSITNSRAMAIRAMIYDAGVSACVESASTPKHWDKIRDVFGIDELVPYLNVMPGQAKGRLIQDELGI